MNQIFLNDFDIVHIPHQNVYVCDKLSWQYVVLAY